MIKTSKKAKYPISILLLVFFAAFLFQTAFGQSSSDIIIADENNCEQNLSYFDILITEANTYPGSSVILIARLGDGENSRKYNQRRLAVVKAGLSAFERYPAERVITTQGGRVRGKGQVEVYIGGRLVAVFKAGRRKNLQDPNAKECAV